MKSFYNSLISVFQVGIWLVERGPWGMPCCCLCRKAWFVQAGRQPGPAVPTPQPALRVLDNGPHWGLQATGSCPHRAPRGWSLSTSVSQPLLKLSCSQSDQKSGVCLFCELSPPVSWAVDLIACGMLVDPGSKEIWGRGGKDPS